MKPTKEQAEIISYVRKNKGQVSVSAIAGSGKTSLLVALSKTLAKDNKNLSGLYLAYNKSVATEAKTRFPTNIHCATTHSLAYGSTVKPLKLKVGSFSYRSISDKISYDDKLLVVSIIEHFCLSSYTSFTSYAKSRNSSPKLTDICQKYLGDMSTGKIDCTHAFYLKLFHLMLANGDVSFDPFDIIMIDEAGDLNAVTYEIFKLLPAERKLMVGDPHQNIYGFNHTINCFQQDREDYTHFPMSQSFRVSSTIARNIEHFCKSYLDEDMDFKGVTVEDTTLNTKLYISRTNTALIAKMIELNRIGIQYGLVRSAKQIFALPLILSGLKHRGFIANPEYKFLQADVNRYYESKDLQRAYKNVLVYLKDIHSDDISLQTAIATMFKYGVKEVLSCYKEASNHEKLNQTYNLGTAHACKGLEADQVELAEDMNTAISGIIPLFDRKDFTPEDLEQEYRSELNLYYVAVSRARKAILNARYL